MNSSIQPSCFLIIVYFKKTSFWWRRGWKATQETIISLNIVLHRSNQSFSNFQGRSLERLFPFTLHYPLIVSFSSLVDSQRHGFSFQGGHHASFSSLSQSSTGLAVGFGARPAWAVCWPCHFLAVCLICNTRIIELWEV